MRLPALNTPQFSWNKTRLPRHAPARPGYLTAIAVYANRVARGLLDRKLAQMGYDSQQTGTPASPDRPDNLWAPLPGDRGAFDNRARSFSPQFWASKHRPLVALGGAALAALGFLAARRAA